MKLIKLENRTTEEICLLCFDESNHQNMDTRANIIVEDALPNGYSFQYGVCANHAEVLTFENNCQES